MRNWIIQNCRINSKYTAFISVMLVTVGMKIWIITSGTVSFNSDEAIVGLMARHILLGEKPIFFYGQAYMGSLDAYFISAGFALFGEQVWVIRVVQAFLYLFTVGTTFILAESIFNSWKAGAIAGMLMAIPVVNTSLYTTATLGGYGEAILLGNLIAIVTIYTCNEIRRLLAEHNKGTRVYPSKTLLALFFCLGLLTGLGLWVFGLTGIYSVPSFLLLGWLAYKARNRIVQAQLSAVIASVGCGLLLGAMPWWMYAINHGLSKLLSELGGTAIAIENSNLLMRTLGHLAYYFLMGIPAALGFRPPWEIRWIALPLIPLVLIFWGLVIGWSFRKLLDHHANSGLILFFEIIITQFLLFIFTPFGVDPSGRYFLPIAAPLAILAGGFVTEKGKAKPLLIYSVLTGVVLYQFWGNFDAIKRLPLGMTTQFNSETQYDHSYDNKLISFLEKHGVTTGYSDYWVSYPLAFKSKERLIFVPVLPYHRNLSYTERDNRYRPYDDLVKTSNDTAFITVNHPNLDGVIRSGLMKLGVSWKEGNIGDYLVYYDLSRPVSPAEIGLGMETQ